MSEQIRSLMFERTEQQSGEPRRPAHIPGLWAWVTRANAKAMRKWQADRQEWVDAGCPPVEVVVRTFIPRATVQANGNGSFTATAYPTWPPT